MDKNKSSFLSNCYEWFFTEDERAPMGFIPTFFTVIILATAICLFITGINP